MEGNYIIFNGYENKAKELLPGNGFIIILESLLGGKGRNPMMQVYFQKGMVLLRVRLQRASEDKYSGSISNLLVLMDEIEGLF